MTKDEKIKLGAAIGILVVAVIILIWYFFLSAPPTTPIEPIPEGTPLPSVRTPK